MASGTKPRGRPQSHFIVRRWNKFLSRYIDGTGRGGCTRWSWEGADAKRFDKEEQAREWLGNSKASIVRA